MLLPGPEAIQLAIYTGRISIFGWKSALTLFRFV